MSTHTARIIIRNPPTVPPTMALRFKGCCEAKWVLATGLSVVNTVGLAITLDLSTEEKLEEGRIPGDATDGADIRSVVELVKESAADGFEGEGEVGVGEKEEGSVLLGASVVCPPLFDENEDGGKEGEEEIREEGGREGGEEARLESLEGASALEISLGAGDSSIGVTDMVEYSDSGFSSGRNRVYAVRTFIAHSVDI